MTAPPPELAALVTELFNGRLAQTERYAELLGSYGASHGLLGPKEQPKLWDRHLINCALVADLLPDGARVVDLGSGSGLPGLVFACRRPDLKIDLVESMRRRIAFLHECVEALGLQAQVRVVHGRAESPAVRGLVGGAEWVSARAVAPLDRLTGWSLPLLRRGGRLLAIKGAHAMDEVTIHASAVKHLGGIVEDVVECGVGRVVEPTTVVIVRRER